MHSSRMRTVRLLPVSPSMHYAEEGGVCFRGVSAFWGVCFPEGCVSQHALRQTPSSL